MRKTLFVLGLAVFGCASLLAQNNAAPADAKKDKNKPATARETGSGMATGRREATSGMATGKTEQAPAQDQKNIVHRDLAAREASSGMATGRREASATEQTQDKKTETSGDPHENSARETSSGMATGRREASSGMATGRRQHEPILKTESTDASDKHKGNMGNAQNNPMYKDGGTQGTNPMYENKDKVQAGVNATGSAPASGASVVKTKTKSNQSNDKVAPAQPTPPQSKKD